MLAGSKPIELIANGDLVLSRSENEPSGPVEGKVVEKVFIRVSPLLNLHVGGQLIRKEKKEKVSGWVFAWQPTSCVVTIAGITKS